MAAVVVDVEVVRGSELVLDEVDGLIVVEVDVLVEGLEVLVEVLVDDVADELLVDELVVEEVLDEEVDV